MPLNFTDVDMFLVTGLNTRTDDKLADAPGSLSNAEWVREGVLSKRRGYTRLDGWLISGTLGSPSTERYLDPVTGLAVRRAPDGVEDLVAVTSSSIASWAPSSTTPTWDPRGQSRRCRVTVSPLNTTNTMLGADQATLGGVTLVTWCEVVSASNGANVYRQRASVLDASTHAPIVPPYDLTGDTSLLMSPRAIAFNGTLYAVHIDPAHGLGYQTYVPDTPWSTVGTFTVVDATVDGSGPTDANGIYLDAKVWNSTGTPGTCIAIASMAGTDVVMNYVSLSLSGTRANWHIGIPAVQLEDLVTTAVPYVCIHAGTSSYGLFGDIDGRFVNSASLFVAPDTFGPGYHADVSGNLQQYAAGIADGTTPNSAVQWYMEFRGFGYDIQNNVTDAERRFSYIRRMQQSGSVVTDLGIAFRHAELASHPFDTPRGRFLVLTHYEDAQANHMLVGTGSQVWASFADLDAYVATGFKPRVTTGSNGQWELPVALRGRLEAAGNLKFNRAFVGRAAIDLDPPEATTTQADGLLALGGGNTRLYDGLSTVEAGFLYSPSLLVQDTSAGAAVDYWSSFQLGATPGPISAGTYGYYATYRWLDNDGREHRSAPSVIATLVTTASCDVVVRVPTLTFTDRRDVRLDIWRTVNLGQTAYLVTSGAGGELRNDTNAHYVSFDDRMTDEVLVGQEELYTQGTDGELANIAPGPMRLLETWQNRLWGVQDDDGLTLWFSKQMTRDLAPEFNDALTMPVDPAGGRITALAALDDKLLIFKADRIYYTNGEGPDATGGGGSFALPRLVQGEVGCIQARSVVNMGPLGIAFQSQKGIYVIDSNLQQQFIGAPVWGRTQGREVTGAVLLGDLNQVRFTLRGPERSPCQLTYDTLLGRWTEVSSSLPVDAATEWRGAHVVGGNPMSAGLNGVGLDNLQNASTGSVWLATSGSFVDNGVPYGMRIQTPWIKTAGIEGFQRLKRVSFMGSFASDFKLRLGVEYDYVASGTVAGAFGRTNPAYDVTGTVGSFQAGTAMLDINAASGTLFQFSHDLRIQKAEAVRFTLTDLQQSGSFESFELEHVRLRVGTLPGGMRLPAVRKLD